MKIVSNRDILFYAVDEEGFIVQVCWSAEEAQTFIDNYKGE